MSEPQVKTPGAIVAAAALIVLAAAAGVMGAVLELLSPGAPPPLGDINWPAITAGFAITVSVLKVIMGILLLRRSKGAYWWALILSVVSVVVDLLATLVLASEHSWGFWQYLPSLVLSALVAALLLAGKKDFDKVSRSSDSPVVVLFRSNVREYGMYIALLIIFAVFTIFTNGLFLSPRNIADLMNQTAYIAVLAVGMTLVIVIRHIDLSVGFLAGFLGAVAAIGLVTFHLPVWVVIPLVMILGILAGLLTALPVAKLGIPSFVASLAGWLIYRGLLLRSLSSTGTIKIDDPAFLAIGNSSIPDLFPENTTFLPGLHKVTLLLGLLAIIWFIVSDLRNRAVKKSYHFNVVPVNVLILKLVLIAAAIGFVAWELAGYNGMGWTVLIMLVVVGVYDWVSRQTVFGRHIYAVGGNPEAAELSGISVSRVTMIVFGSMGLLSGLAGILFASRLSSAGPSAGTLFELDTIAAAYIGGVSAAGGVGKITGSLVGAIVYMSLRNGMNLIGVDESIQYIIRGAVLALAVIFDVSTRRVKR